MANIYTDYMAYVDTLESPTIYNKWCCMSTVAACAGRKIWLDPVVGSGVDGQAHYKVAPNLYVVLVGPPGIGKDTAMNVSRNLIAEVKDIPTKSDNLTKEFIYKHMSGIVRESVSPDRHWRINHASLTIFSSEMSTLIKKNDRDFVGMLNYLFNTQPYAGNSTKGQGEDIFPNPYLNILAGTTPDWVNLNIREDVLEGGFAARTIFVYAEKKSQINAFPAISPSQKEARDRVLAALKVIAGTCRELHLTPDARSYYVEWYNQHSSMPPTDYRILGYFGRKPAFMQKLAIVFALIRDPNSLLIEKVDIATADWLLQETEPLVKKSLSGVGRNQLQAFATRMLNQLSSSGGWLPLTEWWKLNRNDLQQKELTEIIQNFISDGVIKAITRTKDGQPTQGFALVKETNDNNQDRSITT